MLLAVAHATMLDPHLHIFDLLCVILMSKDEQNGYVLVIYVGPL